MRLHDLFVDLPVRALPPENPDITGVCHDSRRVEAGDLFVAIAGERFDGRRFSPDAGRRGAVAVLGAGEPPAEVHLPWIAVDDPRRLLGPLSVRVYGRPHERLRLVGVTGTNGKSTVIHLLASVLDAAGEPPGRIGTLGYSFGERAYGDPERTTPEACDLFRVLDAMARDGAKAAVMEVSSIALEAGRVDGAEFDLALFLNLSRDHLDVHRTMERYFAAKRRLLTRVKDGGRIAVSVDDAWGRRLAAELPAALTFGEAGVVRVEEARLDFDGIDARIATPRGPFTLRSPLLGRFNLLNLLAAVAGAEALELPPEAVATGLAAVAPVSGRLQPVAAGQPFPVLVDYAHTPAGLEHVLRSLRELSSRRLVVVFGCGGDRDPSKRAPMGRIAGELADLAIATSDNPRGEDPLAILAAVEEGLVASGGAYRIEADRRAAIRQAIELAQGHEEPDESGDDGWAVLVAGKGHESVQILGRETVPFSDREVARAILEERHG